MMKRTELYTFFAAFLAFFCLTLSAITPANAQQGVFNITNVKVDVTAESASKARKIAFHRAQVRAFSRLMNKMMSDTQLASFQRPEIKSISLMVKDFEIVEEKLSAVRYVGMYNFRFNGDAVRTYLATLGVQYSDVQSRPILILPFYQLNNQTTLWSGANPWYEAWKNAPALEGLVPMIVPIGDLADIKDIGDNQALNYDAAAMQALMKRYNVQDTVIAIAAPQNAPALNALGQQMGTPMGVYLYRVDTAGPQYIRRLDINTSAGEPLNATLARAVISLRREISREWKKQTVVQAGQTSKLEVQIPFLTMQEWLITEKALRNQQAISHFEIVSISPRGAKIRLGYRGTLGRLKLSLAQGDITLDTPSYQNAYATNDGQYRLFLNRYRPMRPEQPKL